MCVLICKRNNQFHFSELVLCSHREDDNRNWSISRKGSHVSVCVLGISSCNVRREEKNKNEIFIWHQFEINDFFPSYLRFVYHEKWTQYFSCSTLAAQNTNFIPWQQKLFVASRFIHVGELHWEFEKQVICKNNGV